MNLFQMRDLNAIDSIDTMLMTSNRYRAEYDAMVASVLDSPERQFERGDHWPEGTEYDPETQTHTYKGVTYRVEQQKPKVRSLAMLKDLIEEKSPHLVHGLEKLGIIECISGIMARLGMDQPKGDDMMADICERIADRIADAKKQK
jgi:hypothetical protein